MIHVAAITLPLYLKNKSKSICYCDRKFVLLHITPDLRMRERERE